MSKKNMFWHDLSSVVIGIYCLITVILFVIVFVSSLRPAADIFKSVWSFPKRIILDNYIYLIKNRFFVYFRNSTVVTAGSIIAILFLSSLAAFGLGKFKFKGSTLILGFFLLGVMFPAQVGIVPMFNIVKTFHLSNSLLGLIIIYASQLSIPVFVLTNFLKTIPDSIIESAKIDGAGTFRIYARILMPMLQPAIGALIPLTAVNLWNDLFFPLVFIASRTKQTMPLGVLTYYSGKNGHFELAKFGIAFAAVCISILPMVILYIFGSSKIIDSITEGAIKQ